MSITLKVKFAWWVLPYIRTCIFLAWMTGLEPDPEKMSNWIGKGMRFGVE